MDPTEPVRVSHALHALLRRHAHFADEPELHTAVAEGLRELGLVALHEASLSRTARADFLVPERGLVVEIKVGGSLADLTRQLYRYAEHEACRELLVVTTRAKHRRLPPEILGKPLELIHLDHLAFQS